MLKDDRSFQRRWEIVLADNKTSIKKPPFYIRRFFLILVLLGLIGGAAALWIPSGTDWLRQSGLSGEAEQKSISDLRLHFLYITGGIIAILTLLQTNWKNQVDRHKVEADIKKNEQDAEKNERDHIRQVHAERRSRYTKAIEQLANEKAAVRLGGIYTLVGLVDEWLADDILSSKARQKEGQVIINNLCSYVRSPFPHAELRDLFEKNNLKENIPEEDRDEFLKKQARFREEQDIRHTILTETTNRLSNKKENPENENKILQKGSWSDFSYNFSGAQFLYNVNFRDIVLNSRINFSHSVFAQVTSFHNSIFEGEAFFGGARFEESSSFIKAVFKQVSFFDSVTFKGATSFKYSAFNGSAIFHDTVFMGTTSFASTCFKEKADFKDASLTGHASFSRTTFKNEAIFTGASFNKIISPRANPSDATADFNGATFENIADFRGAYFEGFANFSEANFESDANFISIIFNEFDGFIDFTDATFISSAKFINSTFFGSVGFYGARFINKEPRFAFPNSSILMARFSCSVAPESYIFGASTHSPYKIQLGQSEINGKKFIVPKGTILFDPKSWDEEKQKYTRVSEPATPLDDSDEVEEDKPE